ncbi:MAG TPA: glucosaminidase domain-containing protein [Acidimicrobiales bacterium]|nr:glucosaminidase domain-containing protein [Acidimicrobiales bacterium]
MSLRRHSALAAALAVAWLATAVIAAASAAPAGALAAKPPVATTTVPATTTTLPVPTLPSHGPGPNPQPGATSTTTPAPTTTVAPQVIDALVRSVQNDLAQLDAIAGYDQDKGIVSVNQLNANALDSDVDHATQTEAEAAALVSSTGAALANAEHRLAEVAVALYVRSDVDSTPGADPTGNATINRGVVLGILITHGRDEVATDKRQLADAKSILTSARQRLAAAQAARDAAHATLSKSAVALANAKLAAAGRAVKATTGTPLPTIMGPPALSVDELAGWYASTGYRANTTVPLATLAAFFLSTGKAAGLRSDIAFAQSIVETGYFTFPAGGQVAGGDNNFAGIGACDSCAHGWRFPNAQTGVAAQIQLLAAYASPKKIPTPLVGRVGVAGCCPTWLALSGVWATARNYGYAILSIYKEILDWAIPQRLAVAGL